MTFNLKIGAYNQIYVLDSSTSEWRDESVSFLCVCSGFCPRQSVRFSRTRWVTDTADFGPSGSLSLSLVTIFDFVKKLDHVCCCIHFADCCYRLGLVIFVFWFPTRLTFCVSKLIKCQDKSFRLYRSFASRRPCFRAERHPILCVERHPIFCATRHPIFCVARHPIYRIEIYPNHVHWISFCWYLFVQVVYHVC